MKNELDDNQEDYCSLDHENWCKLLSKIKAKDNRKKAYIQIKKIAYCIAASSSDSNVYDSVPMKKKTRPGVLHIKPKKRHPSIRLHSTTACFEKMKEYLSISIFSIAMKTVLSSAQAIIPSDMYWEYPWEVGLKI